MRPSDIKLALNKLAAEQLPGMMWGSPGIGKSSIVAQLAREQHRKVFDIRLALLDPTDLRGIPFYNPETKSAEWAPATILPKEKGGKELIMIDEKGNEIILRDSHAILFLDEINAAPPIVQAAAYQLVLDRRIGDYHLPEGVSIIAAGNGEGDKAVTFKMPTPLLNRFIHLDYDVDFEDWHDWAVTNAVEPDVVGFLNYKKPLLNKFDPKSASRGFPTPRSWEFASRVLDRSIPDNVMRHLIGGAVGEGAAIEFMAYREVYLKLPDPADILDGKVKKMPDRSDLSAAYSMITALSYELKERHDKKGKGKAFFGDAGVYFEFIHNNFAPEFCVMGVRDCLKNFKLPMVQAPNWQKFAKDYAKFVMAA